MSVPVEHLHEAKKFEGEAVCHLYEVQLKRTGAWTYFWNHDTVTWQGKTYSYLPCEQDKDEEVADDKTPRPTLNIFNPEGVLTPLAKAGEFDLATVIRKEVHYPHLTANLPIFKQRVWFVGRVMSATHASLSLELRSAIDIPEFMIPPRRYAPPDFPFTVTYE